MDRLQGYNTDGHEYRISEIDRSNSRRLKWMMNEARKNVELREEEQKRGVVDKTVNNIAGLSSNSINGKQGPSSSDPAFRDAFRPDSVNKFRNMSNNNSFNKKGF